MGYIIFYKLTLNYTHVIVKISCITLLNVLFFIFIWMYNKRWFIGEEPCLYIFNYIYRVTFHHVTESNVFMYLLKIKINPKNQHEFFSVYFGLVNTPGLLFLNHTTTHHISGITGLNFLFCLNILKTLIIFPIALCILSFSPPLHFARPVIISTLKQFVEEFKGIFI